MRSNHSYVMGVDVDQFKWIVPNEIFCLSFITARCWLSLSLPLPEPDDRKIEVIGTNGTIVAKWHDIEYSRGLIYLKPLKPILPITVCEPDGNGGFIEVTPPDN